jgi:chorismate mutase
MFLDILNKMQQEKFNFTFEKIDKKEFKEDLIYNNYKFYFDRRKKIIQRLIQLNEKLHFNRESIFLSIHFMDIISNLLCINPSMNFERLNFKKFIIACTQLASKFTENDPNIPNVIDYDINMNDCNGQSQSVNEIKKIEVECLILLEHKLNYSTPISFLKMFTTIGFYLDEDFENYKLYKNIEKNSADINYFDNESFFKSINESYKFCDNLLFKLFQENQIFNVENEFDGFRFVCAIIYLARESFYETLINNNKNNKILKKFDLWPKKMTSIYNIKFDHFKEEYILIKK